MSSALCFADAYSSASLGAVQGEGIAMLRPIRQLLESEAAYTASVIGLGLAPVALVMAVLFID